MTLPRPLHGAMLAGLLLTGCALSTAAPSEQLTIVPGSLPAETEPATGPGSEPGTGATAPVPGTASLELLTTSYGCGEGWALSNDEQTVGLLVMPTELFGTAPPVEESVVGGHWSVELVFGRHLFVNWCDDVIEPDEPERIVDRTFTGSAGTVVITGDLPDAEAGCPQTVTAELRDLVVVDGTTTIELGSTTVENDTWGCYAG